MAHIDLSDSLAPARYEDFGGIGSPSSAGGILSDIKNFRINENGNPEVRPGFTHIATLGTGVRALIAVSDDEVLFLIGSEIKRLTVSTGEISAVGSVATASGDACFFRASNDICLVDAGELYIYSNGTFSPLEGYVPLYADCWDPDTFGAVSEELNIFSSRVRMSYKMGEVIPTRIYLPFSAASIDGAYVNGVETPTMYFQFTLSSTYFTITNSELTSGDVLELFFTLSPSESKRGLISGFSRAVPFGCGYGGFESASVAFYGSGDELYITDHVSYEAFSHCRDVYGGISPIYLSEADSARLPTDAEGITGACRSGGALMVFTERSAYIAEEQKGEGVKLSCISTDFGCAVKDGSAVFENSPVTYSDAGILLWRPSTVHDTEYVAECISSDISRRLPREPSAYLIRYFGKMRELWFYGEGDDRVFVYNAESGLWYTYAGFAPEAFLELGGDAAFIENGALYAFSDGLTKDFVSGAEPHLIQASIESVKLPFGAYHRHKRLGRILLRATAGAELELTIKNAEGNSYLFELADSDGDGYIERRLSVPRSRCYTFSLSHLADRRTTVHSLTLTAVK